MKASFLLQALYIYPPHRIYRMKRIAILALGLLYWNVLAAQTKSKTVSAKEKQWKLAVKATTKRMDHALVKQDLNTFVKTTYPKVVENTEGGAGKIVADLKKQLASMEAQDNKIVGAWTGDPANFVDTAGELQCTIPQYMKIQLSNGMLTTQTTLMGFSPDQGKTWYFIDATDKPLDAWRKMFPNISSKLVLKPAPQPKFVPNVHK